ncbi:CHAD domain-containing protein [Streptomyces sp. SID4928]|uniref:CHAD domain-containing protein n=1 Tax=unclassified Streptomyces TaxID=2593676 RepID=UPI0002034790|nr:CHAD domain-containing protein [Streptomyces sp. ACT-1]EGE43543.1 CHAD domain containing protein [Streptomyces sp. ACT-1]MYR51580.1 CHAD domain-containing protein [Streptomyces sp. SID4928]
MRRPDQQTTTRPTPDAAPGPTPDTPPAEATRPGPGGLPSGAGAQQPTDRIGPGAQHLSDATAPGAQHLPGGTGAARRPDPAGSRADGHRPTGSHPAGARPTGARSAGDLTTEAALAPYLRGQAAEFLRSLRLHHEHSAPADSGGQDAAAATRALRRSARRISGCLHTFRAALDPLWADQLRAELAWLSGILAREHAYADRLTRLVEALHQLSGPALPAARSVRAAGDGATSDAQGRAALGVGAARAGALLERRLTLARTRSHSAALQALGSSRFHAVADAVALLASDVPLAPGPAGRTAEALLEPAEHAEQRLLTAVAALPPADTEPYNEAQDAAWHQTRLLLRLHRYAHEVVLGATDPALTGAGHALDLHRDAVEAAGAAAAAARTPRIAPATAYALGVLHADQRHEVEAARAVFRETWPYTVALSAS